jgi:hypothetical protein
MDQKRLESEIAGKTCQTCPLRRARPQTQASARQMLRMFDDKEVHEEKLEQFAKADERFEFRGAGNNLQRCARLILDGACSEYRPSEHDDFYVSRDLQDAGGESGLREAIREDFKNTGLQPGEW